MILHSISKNIRFGYDLLPVHFIHIVPWWRHQMETFFRVTGPLCREFTGYRWIPLTKASDAELWCIFYVRPNKRLSKQW